MKLIYINLVISVGVLIIQIYVLYASRRAYRAWREVSHLLIERVMRLERIAGIHYEEEKAKNV